MAKESKKKEAKTVPMHVYASGLRSQYAGAGKSAEDVIDVPAGAAEHIVETGLGRMAKAGRKKKAERADNPPA